MVPGHEEHLPELRLEAWEQSKITLNLYLQIVGKVQLALMPRKNHWWNITFLVNSKGLITHVMPAGNKTFEIQFNFMEHKLEIITSNGFCDSFSLEDGLSVAAFYHNLFSRLQELNIDPRITPYQFGLPEEHPIKTPFNELTQFSSYDAEYVQRFWRILVWTNEVFIDLPRHVAEGLRNEGFRIGNWPGEGSTLVRLVTAFNTTPEDVTAFVASAERLAASAE